MVLFGFAIRTDVDDVRLAIVDPAPDDATLALRSRFAAAGMFTRRGRRAATSRRSSRLFQRGDAQEAIVFEPGFAEHLARGLPARLLIVTDATEPNTGSAVQAYAPAVIQGYQRELRTARAGASAIVPRVRMRFNPTRESSNLFVPGLMAFVLTIISSLMTAISLTREKETGTHGGAARLAAAALADHRRQGRAVPRRSASSAWSASSSRRGWCSTCRCAAASCCCWSRALLFILVSLSLGILVSARTSSQRVAMMGAMVGTMLPTMLLSGFIFPVESMPAPLQAAVEHRAGAVVRARRAQHHAEGRRARLPLARDAGSASPWRCCC